MKYLKNMSLKMVKLSILYGLGLTISAPASANEPINMSVSLTESSKNLQITKADTRLYNAQASWSNDSFSLLVTTGHEKQQGKIVIDNTSVKAFDKQQLYCGKINAVHKRYACQNYLVNLFVRIYKS